MGDAHKCVDSVDAVWFANILAVMSVQLGDEADRLRFDLIVHIPWGQVVSLRTAPPILRPEGLCRNVRSDSPIPQRGGLVHVVRRARPHTFKGFLPSLDRVFITQPTLSGDWSPFTDFLSRRAAFGNRIS